MKEFFARKRYAGPIFFLTLLVFAFFYRFLSPHRIILMRDMWSFTIPRYSFYRDALLNFSIPLWNPYTGCGEPFLANPDSAVLYPLSAIFLFFPAGFAITIFSMTHFLIAAVGMYWLCRLWDISRTGSLLASVSFTFSTTFVTRLETTVQIAPFAWFPIVIAVFSLWIKRREIWIIYALAAAIATQLMAGYPETVFFTLISMGLLALAVGCEGFIKTKKIRALCEPALILAGACLIAGLLCMALILPSFEAMRLSGTRSGIMDPDLARGSLHPLSLFTLLIPSLYGIPGILGRYWAPATFEYWLGTFYIGVVPITIFLMVFSWRIFGRGGKKDAAAGVETPSGIWAPYLLLILFSSFFYAMGKYTPFFSCVWHILPIAQKFRWPSKALVCTVPALCALSGIGLDYLARRTDALTPDERRRYHFVAAVPALFVLSLAGFVLACLAGKGEVGKAVMVRFFNLGSVEEAFTFRIPWTIIINESIKFTVMTITSVFLLYLYIFHRRLRWIAGVLILLAAFIDLAVTDYPLVPSGRAEIVEKKSMYLDRINTANKLTRYNSIPYGVNVVLYGEHSESLYRKARNSMFSGWAIADHLFTIEPLCVYRLDDYASFCLTIFSSAVSNEIKRSLYAMVNCEKIIQFPGLKSFIINGELDPIRFFQLGEPLPRAFVVGGIFVLNSKQEVFETLAWTPVDYLKQALTDKESVKGISFSGLQPGRVLHTLKSVTYGINDVKIDVDSFKSGILVLSDTYYPGWYATVNGIPAQIFKVNGAFRGVIVPAGHSAVTMYYNPPSFQVGALISVISLALTIFLMTRKRSQAAFSF